MHKIAIDSYKIVFHVKQLRIAHYEFRINSKRPLARRGLSLWMWGVKEKDMGGFRHYIKTPFILLPGDNTVILPLLITCHWLIVKLWNTDYVFNILVSFSLNRICVNTCTTDCINCIIKSIYKNSYVLKAT